jgi:acyl-CoA thioester hydrolase
LRRADSAFYAYNVHARHGIAATRTAAQIMSEFIWPIRVYYEDTDSGGVVYYANYLKFMERARTEWLRHLGLEQDVLRERHGVVFAVRSVEVEYLKPARFNQLLHVRSLVEEVRPASLVFWQQITRAGADNSAAGANNSVDETICTGHIKVVCIDVETFRPRPFPDVVAMEIVRER